MTPLEGLEHQVELTDVGPVVLAAGRACDVSCSSMNASISAWLMASTLLTEIGVVLSTPVLNDLVGTEALLALLAVHQRVREAANMTGSNPGHRGS